MTNRTRRFGLQIALGALQLVAASAAAHAQVTLVRDGKRTRGRRHRGQALSGRRLRGRGTGQPREEGDGAAIAGGRGNRKSPRDTTAAFLWA